MGALKVNGGPGWYAVAGDLDGITGPGRREVTHLELRRFDGAAGAGLDALRAFPDLRRLRLVGPRDLDLSPLAGLALESVVVNDGARLDLTPIGELPLLRSVIVSGTTEVRLPTFAAAPELSRLKLLDCPADVARQLWDGLAWDELPALAALHVRVGRPSVGLDLGRLERLVGLRELQLERVDHDGPGPSPLEDPFAGLPRGLRTVIADVPGVEAFDRELELRRQRLLLHLAEASGQPSSRVAAGLSDRWPPDDAPPPPAPWTIHGPEVYDDGFGMAGSLAEHAGMEIEDGEAETQAADEAQARVAAADPALADRIEWDEAGETLITASSRDDLERVRAILGIAAPSPG